MVMAILSGLRNVVRQEVRHGLGLGPGNRMEKLRTIKTVKCPGVQSLEDVTSGKRMTHAWNLQQRQSTASKEARKPSLSLFFEQLLPRARNVFVFL